MFLIVGPSFPELFSFLGSAGTLAGMAFHNESRKIYTETKFPENPGVIPGESPD